MHWADGGGHDLDNLMSACSFHHRQLHEGRYRVERDNDGRLRFFAADGTALPAAPPAPPLHQPLDALRAAHAQLEINADTKRCWSGDSLDYAWAVESLLHNSRAARPAADP